MVSRWFVAFMWFVIWTACAMLMPDLFMAMPRNTRKTLLFHWRRFAQHFPRLSRWIANWGWAGLLIAAVTLESEREYLAALCLAALAALSFVFAVIHWKGIPEDAALTKSLRSAGCLFGLIIAIAACVWIWGAKGEQPWSRLPAAWGNVRGSKLPQQTATKDEPPKPTDPAPQTDLPTSFVLLSPIFPVKPLDHETILILQKGPDSIYNIDMMFWDRPKIHAAHSFAKKALGMFKIHIPELDPSSGGVLPQMFDWQTVLGPARQFEAITTAKGLSVWQTTIMQKNAGQWQYMTRITQYGGKNGGKVVFECKTPSYPTTDEHIKIMQSCV